MNVNLKNVLFLIKSNEKELFTKNEIVSLIEREDLNEKLPIIKSNGVMVNPETMTITYKRKDFSVPKMEFLLLYYLIINKNECVTRKQILKDVWGNEICINKKVINVHVHRIRTIIPEHFIKTNRGIGYRWIEK